MAVRVERMNVVVTYVRQGDGSYVTSLGNVEGTCCDPAGPNPTVRAVKTVDGIVVPSYSGPQTCDAMVAACFANAKTAAGAP